MVEFVLVSGVCINEAGPGEMCFIDRHFDSEKYISVLEEVFIPSVNISYDVYDNMIFVQVNLK